MDLSPLQKEVIMEYCTDLRSRLVTIADEEGISCEPLGLSMKKAVLSRLSVIDCMAEELRPQYMRGYGTVLASHEPRLEQIAGDLQVPSRSLKKHLEDESSQAFRE
ncbi:hypothetical protein [Methanocalculus sp. MSAO_Arc1]|nr:hypothetical protein [Methanocalculus sp. MSAO_Arc1]